MDRAALSDCRNLLRQIQCEAVTDSSDQNLYDILIRSKEKKTALSTWLIQNLFTPGQCASSSFEDLLSMFMTRKELSAFLEGTMSVAVQFKKWKLLMNAVYQKYLKNLSPPSLQDTTHHILSGKLLDVLTESWNQKIGKPTTSLLPGDNRIPDLQSQLIAAEQQLTNLNSVPGSQSETIDCSTIEENKVDDIVQKFLDNDKKLNQALNQYLQKFPNSSDSSQTQNFIQELQRCSVLKDINRNLVQLRDMMDAGISKN